ncbi:MAG: hypothetical protein ABIH46_12010 [Chloroflexota bacterium]
MNRMSYVLVLLSSLVLMTFLGGDCDPVPPTELPDFSRAVFVEASPHTENVDTIKIAVNPDKTASVQVTGRAQGGSQGTWELQDSTDVPKVTIRLPGENLLLTFYKNKEAGISGANVQFFGRWYQE